MTNEKLTNKNFLNELILAGLTLWGCFEVLIFSLLFIRNIITSSVLSLSFLAVIILLIRIGWIPQENQFSILFGASLLVLPFAFLTSLLITTGTIGEEYRTVEILEHNPNNYGQWWGILWWGILPIALGLISCIADFIVQIRTRTTSSNALKLVAGILSALWGITYLQAVYSSYVKTISLANSWGNWGFGPARDISSSVQIIYMGYEWIGVLWLVTGIFLLLTSAYVLSTRLLEWGAKFKERA